MFGTIFHRESQEQTPGLNLSERQAGRTALLQLAVLPKSLDPVHHSAVTQFLKAPMCL